MREPRSAQEISHGIFGLLAEFDDADTLRSAARRAWEAGFRRLDAFTPFPVEGLAEGIGFHDRRVPLAMLVGGVFGAALGYGMQVYINLNYPLNVGGRAIVAPTAFMLIVFELLVLFSVLFGIGAMLILNRLPRLNHPLFAVEAFHLASSDKFFLVIFSNDARFDPERTRLFLQTLEPLRVEEVPFEGAPG
jgi:hypothetical protein